MKERFGRYSTLLAIAMLSLSVPASGIAAAADDAVALHEADLPPPVTVWCLGNPELFAVSAKASGIEIGTRTNATKFERHKAEMTLIQWAHSTEPDDVRDFQKACRVAFVAFSPSGPQLLHVYGGGGDDDSEPSDDDSLLTFGAALVGAGLAGTGGLAMYRRRAHHDDAEELRQLDAEFQDALVRYAESPGKTSEERARVSARLLCSAVGEWKGNSRAEQDVEKATGLLEEILQKPVPYIGNLGEEECADENAAKLRQKASDIHFHIATIAEKVAQFRRLGDRTASPASPPPQS